MSYNGRDTPIKTSYSRYRKSQRTDDLPVLKFALYKVLLTKKCTCLLRTKLMQTGDNKNCVTGGKTRIKYTELFRFGNI